MTEAIIPDEPSRKVEFQLAQEPKEQPELKEPIKEEEKAANGVHSGNTPENSVSKSPSPIGSVESQYFTNNTDFESLGIKTRKLIPEDFESHSGATFEPRKDNLDSIPTYYLSETEFNDPMAFIESIKDEGAKYGAIKIIPPKEWDPEFALELPRLRFRAAKQSLNHPTSNFNDKVQFYKDLLAFHKAKKLPLLRLPSIDRRVLDLFKLRNSVHLKGGFDLVCRKKLWAQIGRELGYTGRIMTSLSTSLKNSYQKVVHSYDLYVEGKDAESSEVLNEEKKRPLEQQEENNTDSKRAKLEQQGLNPSDPVPTVSNSRKIFKRSRDILKSKGFKTNFESYTEEKQGITQVDDYTYPFYDFMYWHKGVDVPDISFPSTEMSQLYTLDGFYENHLKFQSNLFPEGVDDDDEKIKKFWELIESKSSDFSVQSATNLSTAIHGSAFPTITELGQFKNNDITAAWNLNNLSLNEKGLLRYLVTESDSITKPELDISMLYSTQSWAIEDHFLFRADYQHIGGSKVWYFISPSDQEKFEKILGEYVKSNERNVGSYVIKSEFPEPVSSDILETIKIQDQFCQRGDTTNANFNKFYNHKSDAVRYNSDILIPFSILRENGINVRYTLQKPGQFVIKFPKAYSSSVSLGFSINEHVNFATVSWLEHALAAEKWLQFQGLPPCFSFFQLLTTIAEDSKDSALLKKVLPFYNDLIERQFELRHKLKATLSNLKTVNNKFDFISDDNLTQCFPTKVVVIQGEDCFNFEPENFIRLYEAGDFQGAEFKFEMHVFYTDERLKTFQRTLSTYAQNPEDWVKKFEDLLKSHNKPPIRSLKTLLTESERIMGNIPEAQVLKIYLDDANLWIEKVQDILSVKQKNRIRNRRGSIKEEVETSSSKPEEIENLINEIPVLSFSCPEVDQLIEFANEIYQYEITVRGFLTDGGHTIDEFYDMIDLGKSFGVELESVWFLERIVNRMDWVDRAEQVFLKSENLEDFKTILDEGFKVGSKKDRELIDKINLKFKNGKYMNAKLKHFLSTSSLSINIVEMLLKEAAGLPIDQDVMKSYEDIKGKHANSVEERDQIYKVIAKNGVEMFSLRDEKQKKLLNKPDHDPELYKQLLSKFKGDESDIRPKYSVAREILERSRQFLPSNPSDPLDNYLRQAEDWLRRSKRLFGKTNAPFSVLKSHLTTISEKNRFCFNREDKYNKELNEESHKIFCFCRRLESGTMIACEKCNEWYHCKCLKFGRGKSKNVDNYICPICDYRIEIPREYNSPKVEDLFTIIDEGSFLELAPDELYLVREIYEDAANFRDFLSEELNWVDGQIVEHDVGKVKFYLRKLEGATVLLSNEFNQLRQLAHKLDPICDTPPPIIENSTKTKKRRRPPASASSAREQSAVTTVPTPDTSLDSVLKPVQQPIPVPLVVQPKITHASSGVNPDSRTNDETRNLIKPEHQALSISDIVSSNNS